MPRLCLSLLLSLLIAGSASAVTMEWVPVGAPGNPADSQVMNDGTTGYGSVPYAYQISKYEVTNAQYAEFLNAVATTDTFGLYNANMAIYGGITRSGGSGSFAYAAIPGRANTPVGFVSVYDALRFANWLQNGQPTGPQNSGTTEDGAYTLGGAFVASARNPNANIVLTSEGEWYKAAYYDASSGNYHDFPFADGGTVSCEAPPGTTSHTANCLGSVGSLTNVGAYTTSSSPWGTFDQVGNIQEWMDEQILGPGGIGANVVRGGSAFGIGDGAYYRYGTEPSGEFSGLGFRLAMIPEPTTGLLVIAGLLGLVAARRHA